MQTMKVMTSLLGLGGSTKIAQHSIKNISRNMKAVFF